MAGGGAQAREGTRVDRGGSGAPGWRGLVLPAMGRDAVGLPGGTRGCTQGRSSGRGLGFLRRPGPRPCVRRQRCHPSAHYRALATRHCHLVQSLPQECEGGWSCPRRLLRGRGQGSGEAKGLSPTHRADEGGAGSQPRPETPEDPIFLAAVPKASLLHVKNQHPCWMVFGKFLHL